MSEQFKRALGSRIKQLRVAKHWTQQGLADQLGYADAATINYIENGKRIPSIELLYVIANTFDVSISFLLEGEDKSNLSYEHILILSYIDALDPLEKKFLLNLLKEYFSSKHLHISQSITEP